MSGNPVARTISTLALGALAGVMAVVACNGPREADAGGDGGTGTCTDCTCSVSGPLDVNVVGPATVSVDVSNTGPIDVSVANALPIDVSITNAIPLDVNVSAPIVTPSITYKGITVATYDGSGGWPILNAACNTAYPGSRMCSDQQLNAITPAPVPGADAWIWAVGVNNLSGFGIYTAFAGPLTPTFNCSGSGKPFTSASSTDGFIFEADGEFGVASCSVARPIACCGY